MIKFDKDLLEGKFLKRYKRFFADLEINGKKVTAHVANSGSMKGCNTPNVACRASFHDIESRKLKYALEMVKTPTGWVGVNTSHPNKLIHLSWQAGLIPHWKKYDGAQREVKINEASRLDLVLWKTKEFKEERIQKYDFKKKTPKFHMIEIKNVSLAENGVAMFPDSVTERGQKHLRELMKLVEYGHSAEIVFVIQREDCRSFSPADAIDPEYGKLLRQADKAGVQITAFGCKLSASGISLGEQIPIKMPSKKT